MLQKKADHRVGSLKEGKDADVIIYDGNYGDIIKIKSDHYQW